MEYYVIGPDGSKYGPATLETLNKWAAQGRVTATTIIERASDGVRGAASLLPGLAIPAGSTPPAAAPGPASAPPPGVAPTAVSPGPQAGTPVPPAAGAPQTPPADPSRQVQFKDVQPAPGTTPPTYGMSAAPGPMGAGGYPRATYSYDTVPPELKGTVNWGACLVTWIWGLNHRAYVTLLSLGLGIIDVVIGIAMRPPTGAEATTPGSPASGTNPIGIIIGLVGLGLAIWYGAKGYEWAWRSGRFATPDECRRCQATWGWWGLGFIVLCCVGLFLLFGVLFAAMFGMARSMPH